jgi:hypothetical protein
MNIRLVPRGDAVKPFALILGPESDLRQIGDNPYHIVDDVVDERYSRK